MCRSYIGITGFMSRDEVNIIIRSLLADMSRQLMVGVKYPGVSQLDQIFVKHPQIINMVHLYCRKSEDLYKQLMSVMLFAGEEICDGIQLNMTWPDPEAIEKFKGIFPKKKIVLQFNSEILKNTPDFLFTHFLKNYDGLVEYVLFDASMGRGKELDVNFLLPYIDIFKSITDKVNLVVAGGLNANNIYLLKPLLNVYPNLSIDSESALRDDNNDLSMIKAKNYLHEAMTFLD